MVMESFERFDTKISLFETAMPFGSERLVEDPEIVLKGIALPLAVLA
jgi:hypothetical protein